MPPSGPSGNSSCGKELGAAGQRRQQAADLLEVGGGDAGSSRCVGPRRPGAARRRRALDAGSFDPPFGRSIAIRRLSPHGKSNYGGAMRTDPSRRSAGRGDPDGGFGPHPDRDGPDDDQAARQAAAPPPSPRPRQARPAARPTAPTIQRPPPRLRAAAAGHRARRERRRGRPADRARHRKPRPLPAHLPGAGGRAVGPGRRRDRRSSRTRR